MFINSYIELYRNLTTVSKKVVEDSSTLAKSLHTLALHLNGLGDLYRMVQHEQMEELHRGLGNLMAQWGNCFVQQANLVNDAFGRYFKYHTMEGEAMKDLFKLREAAKQAYLRKDTKLSEKKMKLFRSGDASRWELAREDLNRVNELLKDERLAFDAMLPRESEEMAGQKDILFYLSNQCYG